MAISEEHVGSASITLYEMEKTQYYEKKITQLSINAIVILVLISKIILLSGLRFREW